MIALLLYLMSAASDRACITRQILVEAGGEVYAGKVEVAGVIKERMRRSGLSACEEIALPGQFGDRELTLTPQAVAVAWRAAGDVPQCHATHFNHFTSQERWTLTFHRACRVGHHVFYLSTD